MSLVISYVGEEARSAIQIVSQVHPLGATIGGEASFIKMYA